MHKKCEVESAAIFKSQTRVAKKSVIAFLFVETGIRKKLSFTRAFLSFNAILQFSATFHENAESLELSTFLAEGWQALERAVFFNLLKLKEIPRKFPGKLSKAFPKPGRLEIDQTSLRKITEKAFPSRSGITKRKISDGSESWKLN